jgi:hypothetical protein
MSKASRKKANKRRKHKKQKSTYGNNVRYVGRENCGQLRFITYLIKGHADDFYNFLCNNVQKYNFIHARFKTYDQYKYASTCIELYVEDEDLDRVGDFIRCLNIPFKKRFVGVATHSPVSRCDVSAQNRVLVTLLSEMEVHEFIYNVDKCLYTIMRNIKILTFPITSQHKIVELYTQDDSIAQLVISMLNEESFAKWGNKLTKV